MLRQDLQTYLDTAYPGSKIDTEHSIVGSLHIRFELGDNLKNGTKKRVKQSVTRAITLFNETFVNPMNPIWMLIYEYQFPSHAHIYLRQLFSSEQFSTFYNQLELVNSRYFTKDNNGNEILEQQTVRIIIGKIAAKDIKANEIFTGIANNEMGFKPFIDQTIYFFDPITERGFYMYDDRGCYVWSNKANNIKDIYFKRNDWIVDYHRPEIDKHFKYPLTKEG